MPSGARLWWVQHGSPQGVAQETAACTWPCETGRRCSSSGGIIVDSGSTVSESQQEAESVFSQSLCTASSGSGNNNAAAGSSASGSFNPRPPTSAASGANFPNTGPAVSGSPSAAGSGVGNVDGEIISEFLLLHLYSNFHH